MLGSLNGLDGIQDESRPNILSAYVLNRDMETIQQSSEPLHPYSLESIVTNELDGVHNELPQPWGERNQAVKIDGVLYTEAEQYVCRFVGFAFRSPGKEKIRNHFTFPTLETYINQPLVVFSVSDQSIMASIDRRRKSR